MSPARLSALSVLVFGGPKTIGELAAAEQVRPPTMSAIVDGLEEDGLAKRAPDPADRRLVRVQASAKGKRALHRARERRIAALTERLSSLQPDEIETVRRAADLVDGALKRSSAPPAPPARAAGSAGSRA